MASFFYPYKKVGFCVLDKKISPRFQRDFPYKIVYSTVLDSKSADIKAKTDIFLSNTQKCMDIKKPLPYLDSNSSVEQLPGGH